MTKFVPCSCRRTDTCVSSSFKHSTKSAIAGFRAIWVLRNVSTNLNRKTFCAISILQLSGKSMKKQCFVNEKNDTKYFFISLAGLSMHVSSFRAEYFHVTKIELVCAVWFQRRSTFLKRGLCAELYEAFHSCVDIACPVGKPWSKQRSFRNRHSGCGSRAKGCPNHTVVQRTL